MAVIFRRPRLARLVRLALIICGVATAACSLVKPIDNPPDRQARAATLAAAGKHAEAAQAYADLAHNAPVDRDAYELLSAEQWVAAGNIAEARRRYAEVSPEARTKAPTSRALVAAEIDAADNDPAGALQELQSIAVPTAPDLAQNYWYLRGVSEFLLGKPVPGVQAFVERERYLTDTAILKASREDLLARVRNAAEHGQALEPPPRADPIVAGWLALGPVAVELRRDPLRAADALGRWARLYPGHPANDTVLPLATTQLAGASQFPDQIALLLPLSGRAEAVGTSVRDGFIAAYLEQPAAARPRLKIYDVTSETVAGAYQHAMQDGAGFVVGPLTKEDVAALAPLSAGKTPVLALNFLADSMSSADDFYQFALLPEDEARIVARRLIADGKRSGVTILPQGELGTRVGAAFADELQLLGGTVLDGGRYQSGRPDFTDLIRRALQVRGAKGEPGTHRADVQFVFIVGTPAAARLIVSQLKFHYAGDVPVYSTSDSFEPDPAANNDLDGLTFPDMPWMISTDAVTGQIRDAVRSAWPTRTARRDRLYAFGFDAYRLVPALTNKALSQNNDIAGVTGRLHLDDQHRIRRDLDWAQIRHGVPAPL